MMLNWCYTANESLSGSKALNVHALLRTAVDFLLTHHMLLRSEARRDMELADMFCLALDNEGPSQCTALVILRDHGKTNKVSKVEYSAAVRHKDPEACLLFHLAAYFVHLWEVLGTRPPNFQRRTTWYDEKVFPGKSNGGGIYHIRRNTIGPTGCLNAGGLTNSEKKTHLGRAEGAKFADIAGVDESHIRRAGHWRNTILCRWCSFRLPGSRLCYPLIIEVVLTAEQIELEYRVLRVLSTDDSGVLDENASQEP